MNASEVIRGWGAILAGRTPFLSIEITKECPLTCPGCYAYGDEHLGGGTVLRQVSDFRGQALVDGVMAVIDQHRPLHVSLVGGEPLVRYKELNQIIPMLHARQIHVQVVTSAVRPIPPEWSKFSRMTISVSIDGLAPEHDVRRKPATYDRILKNIEGHQIVVHCTVTRQMTDRPGYLREFVEFWSSRQEVRKLWFSLFTPQIGETSHEILPWDRRLAVLRELSELGREFRKMETPEELIESYARPPSDPAHCIFARSATTITADLRSKITPCQFGGSPDCSQCGCAASAGLEAVGRYRLPLIGISAGALYEASLKVGAFVAEKRAELMQKSA
jgi:sulfatase maturation enzyme AslB (radical SAM superfamily)